MVNVLQPEKCFIIVTVVVDQGNPVIQRNNRRMLCLGFGILRQRLWHSLKLYHEGSPYLICSKSNSGSHQFNGSLEVRFMRR